MNQGIDWIQVSTIITALATITYAILTYVVVKETILLRRAQTEPNIVLLIQPQEKYPNLYDIVVKNSGQGAAYNLTWQYDRTSELASKENVGINRFEFFQSVKYFGPGQEFRSLFGSGVDLLKKPFLPALELKLSYENDKRQKSERMFILNPALLYGHSWIGDQPDIADSLNSLQKEVRLISSGMHRIKVDVYDKNEREREEREHRKLYVLKSAKDTRRKKGQ